jgi:hypothetical protein
MATPNDVASILNSWTGPKSGARYNEFASATKLGQAYTPGQAAGTAQAAYGDQQLRNQIAGNFSGSSKAISDAIAATQDRYGKNQADIKNIFGTLSTIRAADKAKIAQQFTSALQASQDRAAALNTQAQQQLAAGQQGAATAGAELGGGPTQMPTDSLTSQAVAQGIADQNANQGVWNNLMQGMSQQQQGNVDTAVQGYNLQQAGALDALRRGYEESMLGLSGQQSALEDQISQAVAGVKGAQAQGQADLAVQQLKNQGALDVAKTRAAAKTAGGSSTKTTTPKTLNEFSTFVNAQTGSATAFSDISAMVSEAKAAAQDALGRKYHSYAKAKNVSKADVIEYFNKNFPNAGNLLPFAIDYINMTM